MPGRPNVEDQVVLLGDPRSLKERQFRGVTVRVKRGQGSSCYGESYLRGKRGGWIPGACYQRQLTGASYPASHIVAVVDRVSGQPRAHGDLARVVEYQ
ncbi:MAG: hypothetical protein IID32_07730 [Planctomycetes bacterium]|nr:hypothetical protein [Planctomycetota bacterium]